MLLKILLTHLKPQRKDELSKAVSTFMPSARSSRRRSPRAAHRYRSPTPSAVRDALDPALTSS